jgi:hypothetical protein
MGAKPRKTGSAARVPAKVKRAPARRVPARRAARARPAAVKTVDAYLARATGGLREAGQRLRQIILSAAPSASESIKWGQPVYEDGGPFCYFKTSSGHITFGFWRGTEISDPDGRLEGDGDRMKHIKIRGVDDLVEDAVADWVRQAVDLNRRLGDPTKPGARAARAETVTDLDEDIEVDPSQIESIQPIDGQGDEPYDTPWNDTER